MRRAAAAGPLPGQPRADGVPPPPWVELHLASGEAGPVRRLMQAGGLRPAAFPGRGGGPAVEHGASAGLDRAWPVAAPLADLLPAGVLRRGSVVAVLGSTSLLWAMISAACRAGARVAVVGMPEAGALAAVEHGLELERLALVPDPGRDWPRVVAALLDGLDIVAVRPAGPVTAAVGRRLAARARQRSVVLLPTWVWGGVTVTLRGSDPRWHGLGQRHGRLRCRQLTVTAEGGGRLARPWTVRVWLPAPDGAAIAACTAGPEATVAFLPEAA